MTRFIKNTSTIILAIAIIVGFMPMLSANSKADAATEYYVWVSGIQVTSDNADDIDGTGTASYDAETRTLTLDGYNYSGVGATVNLWGETYRAGIISFGLLNIETNGTAVINVTDTPGLESAENVAGIACLTSDSDVGILMMTRGKVTAKASTADANALLCGVIADRSLLLNSMTLNASANNTEPNNYSAGIVAGTDTASDAGIGTYKATINAKGGIGRSDDGNRVSAGIASAGELQFDNNSTINVSTGKSGTTVGIMCDGEHTQLNIGYATVNVQPAEKLANHGMQIGIAAAGITLTEDDAKLKVVAEHAFMGAVPEVSGATIYARYSSNIDGTQPAEGTGIYGSGENTYGSSAQMEEVQNVKYFETSSISFKNISSCDIKLDATRYMYTGGYITPGVTVKDGNKVLVEGQDYSVNYYNNRDIGYGKVLVTGLGYYMEQEELGFEIYARDGRIVRLAGASRYETAIATADRLSYLRENAKYQNIIVACGSNFPDALAGSYLAKVKKAPILLVTDTVGADIKAYIENNLQDGGRVYILGGTGAVSAQFEKSLKDSSIKVKRLEGKGRYDTNIAILKAAGVTNEELLVCTGNGYADSLSASAAGKPILLVGDTLTSEQKAYLKTLDSDKIYAIGGKGVVSDSMMKQVAKAIGGDVTIDRAAGASRFETSVAVAKKFFKRADTVTLAYAQNFPDGLSGGPLAIEVGAPLLLVTNDNYKAAEKFCEEYSINQVYVFGGTALISDEVAELMIPPKG